MSYTMNAQGVMVGPSGVPHYTDVKFPCRHMCPWPDEYEAVRAAFTEAGHTVELIERECAFLLWVLCSDGLLWLYDGSHGGGQRFSLDASNFKVKT